MFQPCLQISSHCNERLINIIHPFTSLYEKEKETINLKKNSPYEDSTALQLSRKSIFTVLK